jgi:hypothetical protein
MNFRTLLKPRKLVRILRHRMAMRARLESAIKAGEERFKDDPNYRLDLVPANFAPHVAVRADDSALLRRISVAYQKAKAKQRDAAETFNVSNEWLPIYQRNLGPVMRALSEGNLDDLDRMYSNFFRDPCSTGLAGLPADLTKKYFGRHIADRYRKIALCEALHRYSLWRERTENRYTVQDLVCPLVGNPYGSTIDGVFLRPGVDYHHYYASEINRLLESGEQQVVVELGGGFGGMAFFLVRDNPAITYIDFDLPEACALASYYLMKSLPQLPITLYGEAELTPKLLAKPGVVRLLGSLRRRWHWPARGSCRLSRSPRNCRGTD